MITIGLIGTGHMGSAIIKAADRTDLELKFLLSDARGEAAEALSRALVHESCVSPNEETVRASDLLFLAVKPQNMKDLLEGLSPVFKERKKDEKQRPLTLVTMAAGVTVDTILSYAGQTFPTVRIMPNTPIDVGRGAVAFSAENVPEETVALFRDLLSGDALLVEVSEEKLDAVCALSGCGPAFVYLMIRGMADAGEGLGLSKEDAVQLASKTVEGAAGMVLAGKGTPTELKNAVATPGGATIEGVKILEEKGFEALLEEALTASYRRTLELK